MRGSYALVLFAVPVGGCYPNVPSTTDFAELEARMDALEQENAELTQEVATDQDMITGLTTRLDAAEGSITDNQERLDLAESDISALQFDLATDEGIISDQDERLTSVEGSTATLESSTVQIIDTDITLNVPTDYIDINAALSALDGRVIVSSATVTIQVADGSYTYDNRILVEHPNGDRIKIVGNADNPSAVSLTFTQDGFEVSQGHVLGLLQGMRLVGSDANWGVLVENNAVATVTDLTTEDFGEAGYAALYGGVLYADGTQDTGSVWGYLAEFGAALSAIDTTAIDPVWYGFDAERGAYVVATGSSASGAGRDCYAQGYGYMDAEYALADSCNWAGFHSEGPGSLNAAYSTASNSGEYGFEARDGGFLAATTANASGNGSAGYYASWTGVVAASASTSIGNGEYGYQSEYGGTMDARGATSSGDPSAYEPSASASTSDGAYVWY